MRNKTLVNIRYSLCQKQNQVEQPAETIDAIASLRPIFWHEAAKHFDNSHQNPNIGANLSEPSANLPPVMVIWLKVRRKMSVDNLCVEHWAQIF